MRRLLPDQLYDRVSTIDLQHDILEQGYGAILLDVDNTIRSREDGLVPEDIRTWLLVAKAVGIKVCILSNNWHANVFELGRQLQLPVVGKACKPLPFAYVYAARKLGLPTKKCVVIGDQLCTDSLGGRISGCGCYLVSPLASVDLPHMRVLRTIETRLLSCMEKRTGA